MAEIQNRKGYKNKKNKAMIEENNVTRKFFMASGPRFTFSNKEKNCF